jgi:hypothetical protein
MLLAAFFVQSQPPTCTIIVIINFEFQYGPYTGEATKDRAYSQWNEKRPRVNGLTPERKAAVLPDGQVANQQTGEAFVDCGAARFNFDEKNDRIEAVCRGSL